MQAAEELKLFAQEAAEGNNALSTLPQIQPELIKAPAIEAPVVPAPAVMQSTKPAVQPPQSNNRSGTPGTPVKKPATPPAKDTTRLLVTSSKASTASPRK
jgi:hypothetical protein